MGIFCFALFVFGACGFDYFTVGISDSVASSVATYYFKLRPVLSIAAGDKIIVTFPSQYTGISQSPTCSIDQSTSVSCSYSYPDLTVTSLAFNSGISFDLVVNNLKNPAYAQVVDTFYVYDYKSQTLQQSSSYSGVEITPKKMTSASIVPSSYVVAANTTWTITFTITQSLTTGCIIELSTPIWNSGMNGKYSRYYCSGTVACTGKTGFTGSQTCTCSQGIVSLTLSSSLSSGTYSYSISQMNNPPSGSTVSDIVLKSKSGAYYIEQYELSLTMTQSASISISNINPTTTTVSSNTTYVFSFSIVAPICEYYYIIITFPSDFTTNQYTSISTGIILSNSITASISNNIITLTKGISKYFDENFKADLTIRNVVNPYSTKPSSAITISVTTSASDVVAYSSTGLSVTATIGAISSISISPLDSTIYSTTTYTFSMNLVQMVKSTSNLQISFPSEITVAALSTTTCAVNSGLNSNAQCQVSNSLLKVTGGFPSTFSGLISFSLSSITNPTSTSPTSVFIISAYSDEGYLILYSNSYTLTATPGLFTSPSLALDSQTTGDETSYTISIIISHKIKAGGLIEIDLPSETSILSLTCSNSIGLSSNYKCSSSSNIITVSDGFDSDKTSGQISLTLNGIQNPGTTKPTSSISIYSKYNGYIIDYISSGLSITMTTAHEFDGVSVSGSSYVVGQKSDLTFNISPFNPMYDSGFITIYLPSTVSCPDSLTCSAVNLVKSASCAWDSGHIKVNLGFDSELVTESYSIMIKSCSNPYNTQSTDSFQVFSFIDEYSIDQITSGVVYTANVPGTLGLIVTPSDSGISEITDYSFKVTPSSPVPENGYLEIVFPNEISIQSSYSCTGVISCAFDSSLSLLTALIKSTSSSFQFTVKNIKNPNTVSTKSLTVTTKYNSYSIDSKSVSITFTCHSPCATCLNSDEYCVTCLPSHQYLYNNYCYSTCPSGTTSISSGTCTDCTDPCLECAGSLTTCTKCKNPQILLGSTCVDDCGATKYNETGICADCISHCEECYNSEECQTCQDGYYLYEKACKSVCPSGSLKVGENCENCSEPCKDCENSLDYCTSCISNYSLYDNTCLSDCPDGTTSVKNVCDECELPCVQCSYSVSNCTGCYSSWFLYEHKCLETCPVGTMERNNECIDCDDLCTVCDPKPDTCTSCESNAFLYGSSCVSDCPKHTMPVGSTCVDCSSDCESCSVKSSYCTSCPESKFLYNNQCVDQCPDNITISVGSNCEPCNSTCSTCYNDTNDCTSCESPYSLLGSDCVFECPEGYNDTNFVCVLYECVPGCTYFMQVNSHCESICDVPECYYDSGQCKSSNIIALEKAPLPFTVTGVGSGGALAVSRFFFPATSLTSGTIAVWGIIETGSWLSVLNEVAGSETKGRRLLTTNSDIQLGFILLLICFVGHFFVNISFGVVYFYNILQKDYTLKFWLSTKKMAKWGVVPLALLINFKFIRIMDAQLFGCSCLSANYDKKSNLYKPLVLFSYLSIVLTTLPTLGSLIYILVIFDSDSMAFALALDSLFLTLFQLILSIYDVIILSLLIANPPVVFKSNKDVMVSPNSELMNAQQFTIYNTKGEDTERGDLELTGKVFPEPEDEKDYRDSNFMRRNTEEFIAFDYKPMPGPKPPSPKSRPDMWNISFESFSPAKQACPKILEMIKEENEIDLSNALIDEGSSIIANHIPSGRRVLISKTFKDSTINLSDSDFQSINYDQYVLENVDPENVRVGTLRSKTDGISVKANRNFNMAQIIDIEENGQWTIGKVVKKEEDFDFAHAFTDPDDPEAVVVWNKIGKVYTIVKKDFRGLPKLDPKSNLPMFSERIISNYDPATVEVDNRNVHFANLVADGAKVRVRRNFIGGRILCVIDKDKYLDKKKRRVETIEEPELELRTEELDQVEPDIIIPSEPRKIKKKKKKEKKFKGWDNIEAIYLQRLEPSIKLKRPKIEVSNSFFVKGNEESHASELKIIHDDLPTPAEKLSRDSGEENKDN